MSHVPYRGESPAVTDLVGGRVQVMFAVLATAKPLIDKGLVRALAVTSPTRAEALPDLPTLKEAGIGFGVYSWLAIFAPRDTPEAVQQQLNTAIRQSLRDPQVKAKVTEFGAETSDMSLKELREYVRSEDTYWREALKKVNLTLDLERLVRSAARPGLRERIALYAGLRTAKSNSTDPTLKHP
jgi:tripartite-type tricarboxylate transporter receptor subunit TctC